MKKDLCVKLAGAKLSLSKLKKSELKGVNIDAIISFDFYETSLHGCEFLLLSPRKEDRYSPTQYATPIPLIVLKIRALGSSGIKNIKRQNNG